MTKVRDTQKKIAGAAARSGDFFASETIRKL
jgi:hypothetical protein